MKFAPKLFVSLALLALYIWLLVLHVPFYPAYSWLIYTDSFARIQVSLFLLIFLFLVLFGIIFSAKEVLKKTWSLGTVLFWSGISAIMILNLGMAAIPFPIGWDMSTHYFVTIREIAENWNFRAGVYPYLVELVVGIIAFVVGVELAPMIIVLLGGILLIWGLIRWTKVLELSPSLQKITVLAFFLIPTFQFQLSKDTKLDVILTGVILLGLSFWYQKKHISAAVALGLAPLIKLTAFWFWPGFALYLIHATFNLRNTKKKFLVQGKKTLISLLLLGLPMFLWGSWNLVRSDQPITKNNFVELFISGSREGVRIMPLNKPVKPLESQHTTESIQTLTMQVEPALTVRVFAEEIVLPKPEKTQVTEDITPPRERPKVTARKEELGRYAGWSQNLFSRAYSAMTSKNILVAMRHHTNMGFVWAWIVVGGLITFLFAWRKKQSLELYWIYGMLMVVFVLWIYQGEAVPWYGLPMLMGLLPIGLLWMERFVFPPKVLAGLMSIPVVMGLMAWVYHYEPDYALLANKYWKNPTTEKLQEVKQQFYREEMAIGDILNTPEHKAEKIWKIATMVNAFVDRYDERVIVDNLIDRWSQFSYDKTDEQILALLEHNNIKWFVVDRGIVTIEMDPNGTLHQKYNRLKEFLDTNAEISYDVRRIGLYRIKAPQ